MSWTMPPEVARIYPELPKKPLLSPVELEHEPILDSAAVKAILPHRDPFLFIDWVTVLKVEEGLIAARYDLSRSQQIFAGHFPHEPVWPGVLQVEAIAQAGILCSLVQKEEPSPAKVTMTQIIGARFVRPVYPGGSVDILARVFEDGLLFTIAGQCLYQGNICSGAVITCY